MVMLQEGLAVHSSAPSAFRNSAVMPRQVRLASSRAIQPYRAPFRPPMLASPPKRMGALEDVPMAIGVGAVGIGALLLSGILPAPLKTIAQVAGIGLIAFSTINVMAPSADAAPIKGDEVRPPVRTPIGEPAAFAAITGTIDSPKWGTDVYTALGGGYPVTISLSNPDPEIAVPVRVKIVADEQRLGLLSDHRVSDVVVQDSVILPRADTETRTYQLELMTSGLVQYLQWSQYAITLKLIIERQAGLTGVENVRELDQSRFQAQ